MGAPVGHPFFGNQYTNGGYVRGSFTYEGVVSTATQTLGKAVSSSIDALRVDAPRAFSPKPPTQQSMSTLSIPSLITAGVVSLIGGVAVFMYMRSRLKVAADAIDDSEDTANFGVCESCGEILAASGPAQLLQDEEGHFVACGKCSHRNYARYSEDEDQPEHAPDSEG